MTTVLFSLDKEACDAIDLARKLSAKLEKEDARLQKLDRNFFAALVFIKGKRMLVTADCFCAGDDSAYFMACSHLRTGWTFIGLVSYVGQAFEYHGENPKLYGSRACFNLKRHIIAIIKRRDHNAALDLQDLTQWFAEANREDISEDDREGARMNYKAAVRRAPKIALANGFPKYAHMRRMIQ